LYWIAADGTKGSQALAGTTADDYPVSIAPDGDTLSITHVSGVTFADVETVSHSGQ
jgi:hypothetical protein